MLEKLEKKGTFGSSIGFEERCWNDFTGIKIKIPSLAYGTTNFYQTLILIAGKFQPKNCSINL